MRYLKHLLCFLGIMTLVFSCKKDSPDNNKKENKSEKPPKVAMALIKASVGGTLETSDSIKMVIPAGALPSDVNISVGITGNELKLTLNPNLTIIGTPFSVKVPVDSFRVPLKIIIPKPNNYTDTTHIVFGYNGTSYFPYFAKVNGNGLEIEFDIPDWEKRVNGTTMTRNVVTDFLNFYVGNINIDEVNAQYGIKEFNESGQLIEPRPLNSNSKILLVVHGWIGHPQVTWKDFLPSFKVRSSSGYTNYWTFGYNSNKSISENAKILASLININAQSNEVSIDILAHSMGGLVARSMIEEFPLLSSVHIKHLVTLGTPHLGCAYSAFRYTFFPQLIATFGSSTNNYSEALFETDGVGDMFPFSSFLNNLNAHRQSKAAYYAIAADNSRAPIVPDDGLVTVSSAIGEGLPLFSKRSTFRIDQFLAHTAMPETLEIINAVADYLNTNSPKKTYLPEISTTSISAISSTGAKSGGNITSDGGTTVTARGVCWSTSANPTTANSKTTDGTGNGSFSSNITGLQPNTKYYVRAYATNANGTGYGTDLTFTTGNTQTIQIGANYGGGIIFYIDNTGQHGLICAPTDQSTGIQWCNGCSFSGPGYCNIPITTGLTTSLGAGQSNTNILITNQGVGNYAAYLCDQLVLNGYNDWFLPSLVELQYMYIRLKSNGLGNFKNDYYWSSSEYQDQNTSCTSYIVNFASGVSYISNKWDARYVRAIRAF